MRVPGNERAFTVSPARGIPFPQLVCIGAAAGQSQAFPASAGRGSPPRAPGIGPRPRRRRALLYAPGRGVGGPRAPHAPASAHTHTHTRTGSQAPRGPAPPRGCAHTHRCARPGTLGLPWPAARLAAAARGPRRRMEEEEDGRPGGLGPRVAHGAAGGDPQEGDAPRTPERRRPRGSRDRRAAPAPPRAATPSPRLPGVGATRPRGDWGAEGGVAAAAEWH